MPEYKLRVLKMGQADVPGPEVYWMSHWFEWETLYFYMVVIQGEGLTAIVNTGPPADLSDLNRFWMSCYNGEPRTQMQRTERERPTAALGSVGPYRRFRRHLRSPPRVTGMPGPCEP